MVEKKSRRKLFKVAKELNLSHETISEFLQKKGYDVSGLNTPITDEMHDAILQRFSQEKVKADKLAKRRQEIIKEEQLAEEAHEAPAEEIETSEETAESAPVQEVEPEEIKPKTKKKELSEVEQVSEVKADEVETQPEEEIAQAEEKAEDKTIAEEKEDVSSKAAKIKEVKEAKPEIGDIIDHPLAKKFLDQEAEKEKKKQERKKKQLQKIKDKSEAVEKEETLEKAETEEDIVPRRIRAMEKEEAEEAKPTPAEIEDEEEQHRRKKEKKRKKDLEEELSDKEIRRRKAFEMIRKEGRRTKIMPTDLEIEGEEEVVEREGRRKRSKKKKEVDQQEVQDTLKKTLASMQETGTGRKRRKKAKQLEGEAAEGEENVIYVTEFITVQNLANLMKVTVPELLKKCLDLGQMVTINQRLEMDMIKLLAEDYGYTVKEEEEFGSEYLEDIAEEEDKPEDREDRHPVVTIMGHVDHGKTSLLDYIRHTNVVAGESGGITQHIGAYVVELDPEHKITFLDTPGHEAFTAMRSRGAQVTDIVVLVIAADDKVMPQTEEAIDHARAAGVPIIIAINKIDKPGADPQGIRKQLADRNILVEDWGGKYQVVEVSAKTGQGIQDLLEKIILEAEILELKANAKIRATGVVVESRLDKGKGPVATILIQQGQLKVGDDFIVGQYYGRVRGLMNERNQTLEEAGPGYPVQVLGIDGVPEAGDKLIVMPDERKVKEIAYQRQQLKREQDFRQIKLLTLDDISRQIREGKVQELNVIVKADVDGSAQALTDALQKISTGEVGVKVVRRAVGPITESDVMLAAASQAIIIGFHIRPTLNARELAEEESVDIRIYKVIYDAIDDVKKALEGILAPTEREESVGMAEVRETFKVSRLGTVAGCYVLQGKINRNSHIRLIRNDVEIYDGKLSSLKRFKDDVREVQTGYECGIMIENYNDIKVGDQIEAYEVVKEKRKLEA